MAERHRRHVSHRYSPYSNINRLIKAAQNADPAERYELYRFVVGGFYQEAQNNPQLPLEDNVRNLSVKPILYQGQSTDVPEHVSESHIQEQSYMSCSGIATSPLTTQKRK